MFPDRIASSFRGHAYRMIVGVLFVDLDDFQGGHGHQGP